jgi:hypothetical protein
MEEEPFLIGKFRRCLKFTFQGKLKLPSSLNSLKIL